MLISVIIPTHNRAWVLKEAVESVLNQTTRDFELIVVDDGSTDETQDLLKQFGDKIKVIHQENRGVSAARNVGITASSGDWIAFLDSDDFWKPTKLEKQMKWLKAHPQVSICHTDEIWIRDGVRVNPMKKHAKPTGWIFEKCLPFCVVSPSSVMIHKSLFDVFGFFDEALPVCEDYDLWLRFSAKIPFGFVPEKLMVKRGGHKDQLSKLEWGLDRFRVPSIVKLLKTGNLKPKQKEAAQKMLKEKCRILSEGALKRGKVKEAQTYAMLAPA